MWRIQSLTMCDENQRYFSTKIEIKQLRVTILHVDK